MSKCVATPSCWLMTVWPGAVMWHNEHQVSRDVTPTLTSSHSPPTPSLTHLRMWDFIIIFHGVYHFFTFSWLDVLQTVYYGPTPICTYLSLSRPVNAWLLARLWPPCGDLASDILSQWTDRLSCLTKWTQMIINLTQIFHISSIKYCQVSPQHNL